MNITEKIRKSIVPIINIALNAPSVHNTQPWQIGVYEDECTINIDPNYKLIDGDPSGRQTTISLGIFTEAITIAAAKFGLGVSSITFNDSHVIIKFQVYKNKFIDKDIDALKSRTTDRSIYKQIEITDAMESKIIKAAKGLNAKIWILTESSAILKISELTSKGIAVALSSPQFRHELSDYLVVPWSKKRRGISTSSLYIPRYIAVFEPVLMRLGIGVKSESSLEYKRWKSASGIVLITTEGDMPDYWFEAGRAYLKVALEIEKLGLSQATSAATVEASNYHEDIENIVKTDQRLQSVIRIGSGVKRRNHSPRVTAGEIITLN